MLSDVIGSSMLLVLFMLGLSQTGDEIYLTFPTVIVSAILIFVFNYKITFELLDDNTRFKLSLIFAIFTAPYTFMIPLNWIYY